ncbi:hypothetical protein YQE_09860, partial [Dendroctonus ponderosae]
MSVLQQTMNFQQASFYLTFTVIALDGLWHPRTQTFTVFFLVSVTLPHRFTGMSRYDWNNPPPPGTEYEGPEASSSVHSQIDLDQLEGIKQIEPSFSQALQCLAEERAVSSEKTAGVMNDDGAGSVRDRILDDLEAIREAGVDGLVHILDAGEGNTLLLDRVLDHLSTGTDKEGVLDTAPGRDPTDQGKNRTSPGRTPEAIRSQSRLEKSSKYDYTAHRKRGEDFDGDLVDEDIRREDSEEDVGADSQPESDHAPIPFKNDGSFLEMFKKMQEEQKVKEEPSEETVPKKPVFGAFGKRRGGKVLKTGMVAKVRNVEEEANSAQDAWSVYMQEVRKYKEVHCDDDSKTRPLVK